MESFEFETNFKKLDERSVFANRICKLLVKQHNGDIDKAIIEGEPYFDGFEYFIKNIYELVDNEIPLYAYYRLLKYGADEWRFDKNEFNESVTKTRDACNIYYCT